MPRRPRSFAPGSATHLTVRGVDDERIFLVDLDYHCYLAILRKVTARVDWTIASWCLMPTHVHLVAVLGQDVRVPWAMQTLNSVYAREFNRWHHRHGHVFGERYCDREIATELHLAAASDYVLRNPVTAGIVGRVEEWLWSGDWRLEPRRIDAKPAHSRDVLVRPRG
ncbi:MAG: transposase [Gaiellaceae bacterium MAG52_C11]|nr:transposase [Candidatus Gaiellasilicea maunaloa]